MFLAPLFAASVHSKVAQEHPGWLLPYPGPAASGSWTCHNGRRRFIAGKLDAFAAQWVTSAGAMTMGC